MKKKLRKSLWGLQWIFLKTEKRITKKPQTRKSLDFPNLEDSVASDIEDFPELPLHKIEDFVSVSNRHSTLYKEKFQVPGGIGLPNLSYEDPEFFMHKGINSSFISQKDRDRKTESVKNARPRTVEIRRIIFPEKFMKREHKNEPDTKLNRRKNYGKWFIPPEKWKDSLNNFIKKQ